MAVDTALQKQYSDNIALVVQQLTAKIRASVTLKTDCAGEESYQDQLAAGTAREKTARNQAVVNDDPSYNRRQITPRYFYLAPLVDAWDKVLLMKDPTAPIVQSNSAALARAQETVLCTQAIGTAKTGKTGGTSTAMLTAHIIAASSAGMTLTKLRSANQVLDSKEVPKEDRYLALSSYEIEDLLADTTATSADYNSLRAMVAGDMPGFMGFKFVTSERVTKSSTTRKCFAYHKTGLCLGIWIDMKAEITQMPGIHYNWQIYAGQSYGATRLEEEKVVEIDCIE